MKITKFVHSCLLVEMPAPISRTVLFDPGSMSRSLIEKHHFEYLDDIFITHTHGDHMDIDLIAKLRIQFPEVRILTTQEGVSELGKQGISATAQPPEGVTLFDSSHADG